MYQIKNIFENTISQADFERKEAVRKKLDYYYDKQLDYLLDYLYKNYDDPSSYKLATLNVVRKIIDGLSQVYAKPVMRITSNKTDQHIFDRISSQCAWPLKMKQANRLSKLCGVVLMRPVYHNGRMRLDIVTPDILDVETGDSPEELQAVTVAYYPQTSDDELTYRRWTPSSIERLNYNRKVTSIIDNPYEMIPFVPIWNELPLDTFFTDSGDSLISVQEMINVKLWELSYALSMQGFSVPYVVNASQEIGMLDPGSCLNLPKDSEFGFASPGGSIKSTLDALDYIIRTACMSFGLPASYISSKPSQRKSGAALQIENLEMREKRNEDISLFSKYEKDLFALVKVVQNTHSNVQFGDSTLFVKMGDTQLATNPEEQATQWQQLLDMGLTNPIDIMMDLDPDLTREQAIEKYEENLSYAQSSVKGE